MSDFRASSLIDEALGSFGQTPQAQQARDLLLNPQARDAIAVSAEQGNDLTSEEGIPRDLLEGSYDELVVKYGEDAARNALRLRNSRDDLQRHRDSSRSVGEIVGDAALDAAAAFTGFAGNTVGAAAVRPLAWATGVDADTASAVQADLTSFVTETIRSGKSDIAQENAYYMAIQQELDMADNEAQRLREVESGRNAFMADMRKFGRDFFDASKNIGSDPTAAGELVAGAVGSLGPSAALARGGALALSKGVRALGAGTRTQALAGATGAVASIGASEASGTYAETLNQVMDMTHEDLAQSSVYAGLLEEGYTQQEAKIALANMTAEQAFVANLPAAAALGVLSRKFETAPVGSFAGSGVIGGLRGIMSQGLEEAGQGASSALAENFAIGRNVDPTRQLAEGAGQAAAEGLVGGLGQAGIAAAPAATIGVGRTGVDGAQAAADALFTETTFQDPLRNDILGSASPAQRATEAVRQGTQAVTQTARQAAAAVSPAVQYATDVLDRTGAKENRQAVEDVVSLRETVEEEVSQGNVAPEVAQTVEQVTETTARFAERGFRPTPEDTAAAAVQIQELAATVDSLPPAAKRAAGKVLSSKFAQKVQSDATNLDLNKEPVEDTQTVVNVAKTNPANVDPDQTDRILEMSSREMSPEDAKILKVASSVARTVESNINTQVEIREAENIQLAQLGEKPKRATTTDEVSRQILAKGYETPSGKKLRSINDFAADIIKGVQSPTQTILNENGSSVDVRQVVQEFVNFMEHMNNRVEALNASFDQNRVNPKTGRMTGPPMAFRGLVDADKWVEAENWTGSKLTYHRGSPGSVAFAQQVAADRDAGFEVYNVFKTEFPELFQDYPDLVPVALKTEENPTVLDDDTPAGVSEEQNPETQEQTEDPTAVEVDDGSRVEETNEAEAERVDETIDQALAEQNEEQGESEEDRAARDQMDNPDNWPEADRQRVLERTNDLRNASRALIKEYYGNDVLKRVRQIRIYPKMEGFGPGYAYVQGQTQMIYISEENFDESGNLTPLGKAVVLHETAHVVDYTNAKYTEDPGFISERNDFRPGGGVYNESLFLEAHSPWVKKRMRYANSFKGEDDVQHRAELFAVMTEFYFSKDPTILENSPAILALMEEVYGPRETTGTAADDVETSTDGRATEDAGSSTAEESGTDQTERSAARVVNPEFANVFNEKNSETRVKNMQEFLTKAQENGANQKTLELIAQLAPIMREALDKRLNKKIKNAGQIKTIREHILDGKHQFNRFRAGLLIDPETGVYDPDMVDLATVALADWLITNTGSNPARFEDTLEKMGVGLHEIQDDDLNTIINGVPPSNAADALGSELMRIWDIEPNPEAGIDSIDGVAQGFAKEMFTALSEATNLIDIPDVELLREGGERVKTQTILVKNDELKEIRKEIMAADGKMTAREILFGDQGPMWKVGEKITDIPRTQSRGNVQLSRLERRALKKMQDTPNYLDTAVADVLASFGEGVIQKVLGFRDDVESIPNPVLRRSVRGKNASVLSDIEELVAIVDHMAGKPGEPAYFPVGITKVGRHQYQGPNPQSNKLMRATIAPTWSTVNLNNLDNFWIAVGQASDISGINKAEKLSHAEIVANASEKFYAEYADQVAAVKRVLQGEAMDDSVFDGVVLEPQQLKAIIAVAQMEIAVDAGESSFTTSLSFELDGLTNGVANMMVNYGQGEITQEDFNNFQRVGFFIGKLGKTVNSFFAQDGALDMYEVTSRTGDSMMMQRAGVKPEVLKRRQAAGRVATVIGDFQMVDGQFQMTRNSSKNPMTKVNYGSGVQGVAVGIADSMLLELYTDLQNRPEEATLDDMYYPGFIDDMRLMGVDLPAKPGKDFVLGQVQVKRFQDEVKGTIGQVLTEATQSVIGEKIKEVNDMLVFSTNVQAQYLRNIYMDRLEKLGERLADESVIKRNPKTNKPNLGTIPRKYYRELEDELSQMAPIFVSDDQTLAIGGFAKQLSDFVTSTNYDGRLNQKARMRLPDEVGVRAIPFSVIGSGDAMMMNLIFGSDNAPDDVLGIFDGLDIPLEKIQEYAPYVNEQVMRSWDRDVLSMAVQNFRGFVQNPDVDQAALSQAFEEVSKKNRNTSVVVSNPEELVVQLEERLAANQARKKVFGKVAVSVDQMGGSDVGFSRGSEELGLIEINHRIQMEMEGRGPQLNVAEPVFESTADAVLKSLRLTEKQKVTVDIIRPMLPNSRVVFGTVDQINQWRAENVPDNGQTITDVNGAYDPQNDIIYLTKNNPETVLHEMVHAATYSRVLDHYNGNSNAAVTRLESLMEQFLEIDPASQSVRNAQSAINRVRGSVTPEAKAAALNEFMAYALTNPQVRTKLEKTEANLVAKLKSNVLKLLRRLMGGVPQDMFSHVAFNTRLLDGPPIDDSGDGGGNGDGGNTGGESTPPANNYTNYWIEQLAMYIDSLDPNTNEGLRRKRDTAQDILNADKVLDDLRQAGLLRTPEDRQTFRAIYGIMKSEMLLDSASLIALTKVFQHVEENMKPEMFGKGSEANQTYSAIINSFGGFQRGETSDAVAVLFALSQTSEQFRKVLEQIPNPETAELDGGLNAFLSRGTNIFMKKLVGELENGAPIEVLDGLKQTIIAANEEKEYAILRRVTNTLTQADDYVSGRMSDLAETVRRHDAKVKEEAADTTKQYLTSAVTYLTNFLDKPGSELNAEAAQRAVHMGLPILSIVPVRELVDEFVGTNRQNSDFVGMMDVVNAKIAGVRQAFREKLPGILQDQFTNAPSAEQWASMQKTLAATDFTTVVDLNNMQRSMQLLEETAARQNRILSLENQLQQKLVPYVFQDAKEKAEQLARYMNGEGAGKLLVRNAYAIAKNLDGEFDETLVPIIDELVTMYAINDMDPDIREDTVQLWQNDPQAVTALVAYIQGLNEAEDQKAVSEAAKLNGYKGYVPDIGKENHRIIVAKDQDEEELRHQGYRKVAPFTGDVDTIFPNSYYVTNISQQGMYSQGIMQNVANTYRGVDINTGLSVTGNTSGFISGDGSVERIVTRLNEASYVLDDDNETLMPVFGEDGAVVGFERSVSPVIADAFLGRDNNLATNLGAWAGRQVEEELASQYNYALIDKLNDLYQNRDATDTFVNLKETKDPIYKESFRLIPQNIKAYADGLFDGTGIMVPESMVNLSVGYREASVADLWTGKTRMPKELVKAVRAVTRFTLGDKSIRTLLVRAEQIGQGIVSDAKDIIVIKSLIVPLANTQANIIQLATRGVPTKTIVKEYRKKLGEISEYNKNVTRLIDLRARQRLTANANQKKILQDKIQVIEDLNAKMSIAPMIEAGAYKQLSEGITDFDAAATNGGLADWLESQAEKLPDTLGSLAKIGMVSKSTDLYRGANRATQYGDFLAKSIYYDHLLQKGHTKADALALMNEEYVNFSALPGRTRSMLERNGLTWFMAFKIRIAKIAQRQLRENPVRALAVNAAVDIGSPVQDNIFTVIGEGRMDYATGYEMLFGAPELNPWVNLMSR